MRHFARLILLLLALVPFAVTAGEVPAGFLQTRGRDLVTSEGTVFQPRGIGLGNWLVPEGYMFKFKTASAPREIAALIEMAIGKEEASRFWDTFRDRYVAKEDIDFIAKAGFNTVRVPLHFNLFMREEAPFNAVGEGKIIFEGPGWALLDRVIGWSRDAGLKVIIDLHAAPGGQTGVNHDDGTGFPLIFYLERERRRTKAFWEAIARRYRDEPAVLGYELLNEPISTYNDEDLLNQRLEPIYRELTAAIRAIDPHHIIILSGAQWDQNFAPFGPPFAPNLVYTYHKFWSVMGRDAVHDYIAFSRQHRVPILLGEAGEAANEWNAKFRTLNERFGFGWSFWTYKNLASTSTIASVPMPQGWHKLAALGSMFSPSLEKVGLTREEARRILNAYLEAIRFSNTRLNACYLRSLDKAPWLEEECRADEAKKRALGLKPD